MQLRFSVYRSIAHVSPVFLRNSLHQKWHSVSAAQILCVVLSAEEVLRQLLNKSGLPNITNITNIDSLNIKIFMNIRENSQYQSSAINPLGVTQTLWYKGNKALCNNQHEWILRKSWKLQLIDSIFHVVFYWRLILCSYMQHEAHIILVDRLLIPEHKVLAEYRQIYGRMFPRINFERKIRPDQIRRPGNIESRIDI